MRMMPSMIPRALLMAVLAWLVPGLGHAGQKCWWKAIYFGILVLGTFASGGGGSFEEECDHDFEQCDEAMQIREVFSMSPNEGSTTGGTRVTLTGAGFSQDFLNGGNSVYFADADGNLAAECEVLQGSCTEECTTSSTLICDTKATAASGKISRHRESSTAPSIYLSTYTSILIATRKTFCSLDWLGM